MNITIGKSILLLACLTLSACGGGGGDDAPLLPKVAVTVTPATIALGGSASLNWTSTNATGCSASSAWSGARATAGEQALAPTETGTYSYTLNCSGADGGSSASATLTVQPSPVTATADDRCYGVNYVSFYNSPGQAYDGANSDALIAGLPARTGGNCVNLVVQLYMDTLASTHVDVLLTDPPSDPLHGPSPTEAQLRHAIGKLRAAGLRVIVKPHLDIRDGSFRGHVKFVEEPDFAAWFASYQQTVRRYAVIAQEEGAYGFVVGTELNGLVDHSVGYQTDAWKTLIANVRSVFAGKLIYAADWTAIDGPGFWDLVDYVGVDAYFPLTDADVVTPSVADLVAAWKTRVDVQAGDNGLHRLQATALRYGKPVLFTEVGYQSIDGCGHIPSGIVLGTEDDPPRNEACQANAYQALFETFGGQSWFAGALLWNWEVYPEASTAPLLDDADPANHYVTRAFTPQGKQAEEVLRSNLLGLGL